MYKSRKCKNLLTAIIIAFFLIQSHNILVIAKSKNNKTEAKASEPLDSLIAITISAAGDCTLGNNSTSGLYGTFDYIFDKEKHDYDYFFKNVKSVFLTDDITVVNLEGALTDSEQSSIKEYNFKGRKDYALILKNGGVDIVSLANNHTGDYGAKGLIDTQEALKEYGVLFYGNGLKTIKTVKGVRTAFLGYKGWTNSAYLKKQIASDIQKARKDGDLIIVSFHWGEENNYNVTDIQTTLGRFAIDKGADLVIGHHPHVLQKIEQYKGKYIVYSLGNFCFGGNRNPNDKNTMIFQETFYFNLNKKLVNSFINIIPCKISSSEKYNNYQPSIVKKIGNYN